MESSRLRKLPKRLRMSALSRTKFLRFIGPIKPAPCRGALCTASRWRRGVTLLECLVALTILPLAVAGVAYAVVAGHQQAAEAIRQERGATLAEALMEEILSKPYADPQGTASPGPDAGESTRSTYDNMDDYHGFSEAAGSVKNAALVLYPSAFAPFQRSSTCQYGTQTLLGYTATGLVITVTVSDQDGVVVTLTRFVPAPS